MRILRKFSVCLLLVITALSPIQLAKAETFDFYSYTYDYFGNELNSPDPFTVKDMLVGTQLGEEIGNFNNPNGLTVAHGLVYIVDTGNSRIVVVDEEFNFVKVITSVVINGEESKLNKPADIFITDNGDHYICDTDNFRIIHTDKDLNFIKLYTKPEDETILDGVNFLPRKAVVDKSGRLYLLATNVNKGVMEFDITGKFIQYIGANEVKATFFEVLKKRLMTKEQRDRMTAFVPTEYSNIDIDQYNFLYTTTNTFSNSELATSAAAQPIRKLNSLGQNILIANGEYFPVGDISYDSGGGISGPSRFEDITVMDNEVYYALDRNRGRIFAYDFQGNLLYAFGGSGNRMGYFVYPVAIDHSGTDLYVLDSRGNSVTKFEMTDYGILINKGLETYKAGRYDESANYWREVIKLNGNYGLAYIGIGRALLRQEKFKEAMPYFESQRDTNNYTKAFQEYRKEWVEENIGALLAGVVVLMLLPSIIRIIKKLSKGGAQKR